LSYYPPSLAIASRPSTKFQVQVQLVGLLCARLHGGRRSGANGVVHDRSLPV
jgi:hypothetical protein